MLGFKSFKSSEETSLKAKKKRYRTTYEKWANERNIPIFIKFSSTGIILFGIALDFIVVYNLIYK